MGVAYNEKGKKDIAIECYKEAEANFDKAIKCFQQALEINPDFAEAYFNMGISYNEKDKKGKAIRCYKKAIEINPDYVKAYYNMGQAYCDKGDGYKAIRFYKKAININPEDAEAYNNLGDAYCNIDKYKKAIECYKKAININPGDAEAYNKLGDAYGKKGVLFRNVPPLKTYLFQKASDYDKEIECFKKAAQLGCKSTQDFLRKNGISW